MQNIFEPGAWNWFYITAWFLGSYLFHGLGITLGYHRLLTHKSLKVPRLVMYFFVAGGYLCLMGSPIVWVAVHRLHHQKSDQPGDPHSPRDGFYHALVGWMFTMEEVQSTADVHRAAGDLMGDPVLRLLGADHKPQQAQLCLALNIIARIPILLFFGLPAVLANVAAVFIVFWSTQLVNAVCHLQTAGYRLFDTHEDSRNVWWVAILALGEGWHNNHHAIPKSARHGMAWWEFDITWLTIMTLEKLGLGTNVIRPPATKIRKLHKKRLPQPQAILEVELPVLDPQVAPSVVANQSQIVHK